MFEATNLDSLAELVQSVITPDVVAQGKMSKLNDQQRHKIHLALFGPEKPSATDASIAEQKEMVSQFTTRIAGPIIEALPTDIAAFAVLMLYEEFVNAVFIQPVVEADVGGLG